MGSLKTQLLVTAASRLADQQTISFYVLKKGDPDSGQIFIEVEESLTHSRLYSRTINFDGLYEFHAISGEEAAPRAEISAMIEREIARDEDCWVIETRGEKGLQLFTQIT